MARRHNYRFTAYMDEFVPQWKLLRETLNKGSLGHEVWKY
jgi:hypothetical protein